MVKVLRQANHDDPTAGHVIDVDGGFGWQLAASDVAGREAALRRIVVSSDADSVSRAARPPGGA